MTVEAPRHISRVQLADIVSRGQAPVRDPDRDHGSRALCEQAPPPSLLTGRLYLHFPLAHTFAKTRDTLEKLGLQPHVTGAVIDVEVPEKRMDEVLDGLETALTSTERNGTQAMIVDSGREPQFADFFTLESLDGFIERHRAEPVLELIRNGRLTSVFQPIVPTRSPEEVFAYEALLRGPAGASLPRMFFEVARNAALLPSLDLAARRSAIRGAAQYDIQARLFVNFAPSSIYDPDSCLRSTIETVDKLGIPHERVVFEVIESDEGADVGHVRNILRCFRNLGFGVSLDNLGSGYASLTQLADLRPDFVKFDMSIIRGTDLDPYKTLIAGKLIETAHALALHVIAKGVETAGELAWARDHGVDFVQGYYIARPAAPPPLPEVHV